MTDPTAPKRRPACGRRYSPAQKAQILLDARETSVDEAVAKHGCSAWSIYEWRKQNFGPKFVELPTGRSVSTRKNCEQFLAEIS